MTYASFSLMIFDFIFFLWYVYVYIINELIYLVNLEWILNNLHKINKENSN